MSTMRFMMRARARPFILFCLLLVLATAILFKLGNRFISFHFDRRSKLENINIFNPMNPDSRRFNPSAFLRANFSFGSHKFPIAVYQLNDLVTKHIIQHGAWEKGYIENVERMLQADKNLHLIDIGCNLGIYSFAAAKYGRKVIAVDANIEMIERVWTSMRINKFEKFITLLWNGISDHYDSYTVSSPEKNNVGHTVIEKGKVIPGRTLTVKSILMDDLLKVIDFKKAILKIDIEGHEPQAFRKASNLFKVMEIPAVLMEWHWLGTHKIQEYPLSIIKFFSDRNYEAYDGLFSTKPLKRGSHASWPWDIVWKKRKPSI